MLISAKNAVVSFGVSCQTAYQIRRHQRLISAALNDQDLEWQPSFFDNLIAPASAVVSMFSSEGIAGVRADEIELYQRVRWTRHGLFFWHEQFDKTILSSKYTYLLKKTIDLMNSADNIVCVFSNTQNNLIDLSQEIEGVNPHIYERDEDEIIRIIGRYFGGKCRFLFVKNPDIGGDRHVIGNSRGYIIEHNTATWHGNATAWQFIFRQFFGHYDDVPDDRAMDRLKYLSERYEALLHRHATLRRQHRALREKLDEIAPT
ncbi:hypothetical protein [Labrys wisconsinensis]|uniref:Uncharacterized protein n=1 Tax=Labrys wisconsinensis TaxID=425677 RepID=A0ABU0JHT0_9HYPH|nr:hypothetical protein [Labrys wisconsinensis]MDQ0473838.1 hypothetical protein [Labrys wisconsinensis]